MRLQQAALTALSACRRRRPCSPWRASRHTSLTGTPMRSSGRTARPGSPPGWSPPRSMAWSTPVVVLYAARHRVPVPSLARWLLGLGIAATLTANMAQGWSHGPVGAVVAAWPAVSLVGSYENELLVWLIRTSGTVECGPTVEPACNGGACRDVVRAAPAAAGDGELSGRSGRNASGQTREPGGRPGDSRLVTPLGSAPMRSLKLVPSTMRRWPRTCSACRPAIRCRNEGSPRCSGVHSAAGRVPGSPRRSKYSLRGPPGTKYQS